MTHMSKAVALAVLTGALIVAGGPTGAATPPSHPYFRITVVDEATSRGVPLVRLKTMNSDEFWTDSRGVVAFYEPELMDKDVLFLVETYGYSITPDAQGRAGRVLHTTPSGSGVIALRRENVAQRLYRITGSNIYWHSEMLGDPVPPTQDAAAVPVMGQDSVITCVFKNKIYWLWGDTGNANYPLGNFKTTGATSDPPWLGGLDPEVGVSLKYFRASGGAVKAMVNISTSYLIWCGDMRVTTDSLGQAILVGDYSLVTGLTAQERGLMRFNEGTQQFDKVLAYPLDNVILPGGVPFRYDDGGVPYYYYANPWPGVRSPIDYASLRDLSTFQAFTCLTTGSLFDGTAGQIQRDANGDLVWGWKANTSPIQEDQMNQLVNAGIITNADRWYHFKNVATGAAVKSHSGSVFYNAYRNRWISIRQSSWDQSFLGEVYYLEGDTPLGPWIWGQKVVTHYMSQGAAWQSYSFYNDLHHDIFDQDGGREIFFEGTYTSWLGNPDHLTPDYNYNQVMYKLELDDPRLFLPVPVYAVYDSGAIRHYFTKERIPDTETSRTITWLAPDRPRASTTPIYEYVGATTGTVILSTMYSATPPPTGVVFYGVDNATPIPPGTDLAQTVPLYEYIEPATGRRYYATTDTGPAGWTQSPAPVCRVWPYPLKFNPWLL